MRHWDELHQDGEFWCGEFQTDEIDWQLAELIVNIQYACQKHYFGAMAEMYFDNRLKEASVRHQRRQKTVDGYSRLPEEFLVDDVIHCFNLKTVSAAYVKISRLMHDHLVEKMDDIIENGHAKARFRKANIMVC